MLRHVRSCRVTVAVAILAVLCWAIPSSATWLQVDYRLIGDGQWWRIWTGHLTHYGTEHLFWDLLMFVVLGVSCERTDPRRFLLWLAVLMAGVTLFVAISCEQVVTYRGLSGVDTGLFVWLVTDRIRRARIECEKVVAVFWLNTLLALVGKLVFEMVTGQTFFVSASTFDPLVESHLAGAVFGIAIVSVMRIDRQFENGNVGKSPLHS